MMGSITRNANLITTMMTRNLASVRYLSQTSWILDKSQSNSSSSQTDPPAPSSGPAQPWKKTVSPSYNLSNFDKRILVWSGKYKNINDIPPSVPIETINRARDQCRVKGCLWMMVICFVGCIIQIARGKRAAERGETEQQANIDWHRQYNEASKKNSDGK